MASFFKTVDVGQHIIAHAHHDPAASWQAVPPLTRAPCVTGLTCIEHTRAHRSRIAAMPSGPNRRDRKKPAQLKHSRSSTKQQR
ncbi:MAG: hypothetical protein MZU91_01690 [Desulfosudis oleivorans]|nr:hypothetical protein [Desulfosudis oleivorans]